MTEIGHRSQRCTILKEMAAALPVPPESNLPAALPLPEVPSNLPPVWPKKGTVK